MNLLLLILCSMSFAAVPEKMAPLVIESELSKSDRPLVTAPGSLQRYDRESIERQMPDRLEKALSQEPNVQFVGGPRKQAQDPQIRGLSSERILILEEGVRQNFQTQHSGRTPGDFSLLENVEIVKGPWSSLYGSGALGGVISYRRSTAQDYVLRTGREKGVELALDGGTNPQASGTRITAFADTGVFEPLFSYHQSNNGDVKLSDGNTLRFSGNDTKDFYSSLGFKIKDEQRFTLKANQYNDRGQTALNPQLEATASSETGEMKTLKEDLVGEYRLKSAAADIHAKPYFRKTKVEKVRRSDSRVDIQQVSTLGLDAWTNLRLETSAYTKTTLTLGTEIYKDSIDGNRNGGDLESFPDGTGQELGFYIQPEIHLQKWTLTPGLRWDRYRSETASPTGRPNEGEHVSGKMYLSYDETPDRTFFVGYGQAFNAPRLQDLYITGLHFPGQPPFLPDNFFVPNPDLQPEKADTVETGLKGMLRFGETAAVTYQATAFVTWTRDFIDREVNASGGTSRFANTDRVEFHGLELSTTYRSESYLASLSYGEVRSRNAQTGFGVSDTPADHWIGNLEIFANEEWTYGSSFRYTEKQDRVPAGVETTPEYATADVFAGFKRGNSALQLRVSNVLDRDYRRHGTFLKDPGRDLRFSISSVF